MNSKQLKTNKKYLFFANPLDSSKIKTVYWYFSKRLGHSEYFMYKEKSQRPDFFLSEDSVTKNIKEVTKLWELLYG